MLVDSTRVWVLPLTLSRERSSIGRISARLRSVPDDGLATGAPTLLGTSAGSRTVLVRRDLFGSADAKPSAGSRLPTAGWHGTPCVYRLQTRVRYKPVVFH